MPRFAANLSMLFCERPFAERFAAAARAGFAAVEVQFPYELPATQIADLLREYGLQLSCTTCRPATGRQASAVSRAIPIASRNSAPGWQRPSTTRRRSAARSSTASPVLRRLALQGLISAPPSLPTCVMPLPN